MTEHRYVFTVLAVIGATIATGWWGIIPFTIALDQLHRYNTRLSTKLPDPTIWQTPRHRWQARTGLWPELDDDQR